MLKHLVLALLAAALGLSLAASTANAFWESNGTVVEATGGYGMRMVSDGYGGSIYVWVEFNNGNSEIYAQKLDEFGNREWNSGQAVPILSGVTETLTLDPQIVSDGASGAIITWWGVRNGYEQVFAQRISSTGSVMWTTNGILVANTSYGDTYPQIATDNSGGAIIVWDAGANGIVAQRISPAGSRLWGDYGHLVCSIYYGACDSPIIMPDNSNGAYIVWMQNRNAHWNAYMERVNSSGSAYWTGLALTTSTDSDNGFPALATDGKRGAIVTWLKTTGAWPNATSYVYAQRVSSGGVAQWAAGGTLVKSAVAYAPPQTVSDGMGGAITVWESSGDLFAQRLNDAGALQWGSGGAVVCNAGNAQAAPCILKVSAGRTMIAWTDSRGTDADIYAQELDVHGDPLWTANGTPVCTATGAQGAVQMIAGAILGWQDSRSGSGAVYANLVEPEPLPTQPVPPCTVSYEFFRADNGQPVGRDFMMNGCPFGDFEFIRATLEFDVSDLLRDLFSSEFALVKPTNLITFWSIGDIHADSNVVLSHAVNGTVKTTITHYRFSHNYDVNCRYLLGMDVELDFNDAYLGAIEALTVKSPDYTADGAVNSSDLYYFNLTYGKSMGHPAYNPWFDFTYDNTVNIADRPHMLSHKNQHLPDPYQPSSPSGTGVGVKLVARESREIPGGLQLAVYLENARDLTTASIGLRFDASVYELRGATPSSPQRSEAAFLVSPEQSGDGDLLFISADIDPAKEGEIALGTIELTAKGAAAPSADEFAALFGDVRRATGTVERIAAAAYETASPAPQANSLAGAYPNPFNPSTTISYSIADDAPVNLSIYTVNGQLVRTLVNEAQKSSEHSVVWNGKDNEGREVRSGVYFCRIMTPGFAQSKKLVLLR